MTPIQQSKAAALFVAHWTGKGYEKGESQIFWTTLLNQIFGIEHPEQFIVFEQQVQLDHTSFVDARIPSTKVMIEQKSLGKHLGEGIKQSDGSVLNPFQQAKRYADTLPNSQRPRWIVTCNFAEFWVYDLEHPNDEPQKILLANLEKEYERLSFLVEAGNEHIKREMEVSVKAGQLVGKIYELLLKQYLEPDAPETLRSLNILCVRMVFCLYAEDAHLFGKKTAFHDYLAQYPAKDMRRALIDLFAVLDTPVNERDPYMDEVLKAFPYVNGGLFSNDTRLIIPQFTDELKELILQNASDDFDWSEISPTIFGAVFESTLNPETRRSGGMHYTSIENIHKVIDPLFLDGLKDEFEAIKNIAQEKQQRQKLDAFQDKIASLTFFDPACGSGNFLTESYVSLRRIENEVIALRNKGQAVIGEFANPIKVDIHQFYGIEINDFAVSVATTALWIAEQQMLQETARLVQFNIEPLPLKAYHNIHEGNALRLDWSEVIAPEKLNYIIGNPPFSGRRYRSAEQIEDVATYFDYKDIDYVACWIKKAAILIKDTTTKCCFVSTNSITQGEQVTALWKELCEKYNIHIDFAYRTFRWDSEADIKAHVHCVIIGFSSDNCPKHGTKRIYISDLQFITATNINGYLLDAPDVFITNHSIPLCDVPRMQNGNVPLDGDALKIEQEDIQMFEGVPYIKRLMGGRELLHNEMRYVLWLVGVSPAEIKKYPQIYKRVEQCRQNRLAMKDKSTQKLADTPTIFRDTNNPDNYIAMPMVSSERRRYIPMAYLHSDVIPTNQIQTIPNASLYHFGVLTSNVHMAWMRVVCGRLKSDYRYSKDIVYNNFPWPTPTEEQKAKIEQTAQAILDARAKYPDCFLADLYDEVTMPPELRKAHQDNDRAVMQAYGFVPGKTTESECVSRLFEMYQALTK